MLSRVQKGVYILILSFVLLVVYSFLLNLAFAQTEIDSVSALFFDSCKECYEIEGRDQYTGKWTYGYGIDHGTFVEENLWLSDESSLKSEERFVDYLVDEQIR